MAARVAALTVALLAGLQSVSATPMPESYNQFPQLELNKRDANSTGGNASTDAVHLWGWEKCNDDTSIDKKALIEGAWTDMLEIANAVKGNVHYDKQAEVEFLGYYTKNTDWQTALTQILENPTTWTIGGLLSWGLHMRCDDWLRRNPECPDGTAKADRYKCGSRCFQNVAQPGKPPIWKKKALAYTTNNGDHSPNPIADMNFCPGFFDLPKCGDALKKWSGFSKESERLNLDNYVCQGSAMLHELFHVDQNSARACHYKIQHVYDRSIQFFDKDLGRTVNRQAYGPMYTKIMAKWTDNVGYYVATNADSLALYSLAKWVTSKLPNNEYPKYPDAGKTKPSAPPTDKSITVMSNGTVELGDKTALGNDLGVPASDAYSYLDIATGPCSDADTDMTCNSTMPDNAPLPLKALDAVAATSTSAPNCKPGITKSDGEVALGECSTLDLPTMPTPASTLATSTKSGGVAAGSSATADKAAIPGSAKAPAAKSTPVATAGATKVKAAAKSKAT